MRALHAVVGAAVLALGGVAQADVTFNLDSAPVFGPLDFPFLLFEMELNAGDADAVSWDLVYTTIAPTTTASQLMIDVVGPDGQMVDLDGDDLLALPDLPGLYQTAGSTDVSGSALGMWSLVISDGVQDGGFGTIQGFLSGTITVAQSVPAPGALALLGIAGMTARRRRR